MNFECKSAVLAVTASNISRDYNRLGGARFRVSNSQKKVPEETSRDVLLLVYHDLHAVARYCVLRWCDLTVPVPNT